MIYVHTLSVIGLITIIISSLFLSEDSFYPGWFALFPTIASASIIMAGKESIVNKYILSNKLLIFIGKISYSLYLWHWPLLVFSQILYPKGSDSLLCKTWFIVILSIAISIFSYYFIENPFRIKKEKAIFIILILFMFLIGISSVYCLYNSEWIIQGKIIKD
jgi:peptidoglycan/LPS O-acetylase OafA/YrhL